MAEGVPTNNQRVASEEVWIRPVGQGYNSIEVIKVYKPTKCQV